MISHHRTKFAVTGMGIWSAAGNSVLETKQYLFEAKGVNADILDSSETEYLKLNRKHPRFTELQVSADIFTPNLFALIAASEALADAGLGPQELQKLRVGVCLGSTVGGTNYDESFASDFYQNRFPKAEILNDFKHTNSAQFLLRHFKLNGPALLLSNACTSGLDAIGMAASWLESDFCDLVICGGTETIIPRIYYGFKSLMLTSPKKTCLPFDKNRQGFVLGEGAGIVILEKSSAPRKAKAYLHNYGSASDAHNLTAPHPEARGLDAAIRSLCLRSKLSLDKIDFIVPHGIGSEQSDAAEGGWIVNNLPQIPVVALKGYTGHTIGAAGALSVIFTAMCLQEQKLPLSRGFCELDPALKISPTTSLESGNFNLALTTALGFGGINSVICMGRGQ